MSASMTDQTPLVEIRDLGVVFRRREGVVRAVDGVDFDVLKGAGLIGTRAARAKIVKKGEIKRAVKLKGVAVTAGAKAAIEAAGGSVE